MSFNDFQLINLTRRVEQDAAQHGDANGLAADVLSHVATVENELRSADKPFISMARERARQLAQLSGIGKQYRLFVSGTKRAIVILGLAMLLLGFLAALQALNQTHNQVNIYWLLLLLLGFNTLSMLFWLLFTLRASFSRHDQPSQSPIMLAFRWLLAWLAKRAKQGLFFANWSEGNLLGRVGQWFTSQVLHGAWVTYLVGGLLALLLALSGKQYDFVWGTTILPQETFISTTETLGVLPSALGFKVPDKVQILASKKGDASLQNSAAELRSTWATFLVACIVLYGIFPRCLLWLLSAVKLRLARNQYAPDWGQAYFFQLRSRLLPEHASLGVIDADHNANHQSLKPTANGFEETDDSHLSLPENALWIGYEWGDSKIPTLDLNEALPAVAIDEKEAQKQLFESLKENKKPVIILVPLERVVDRGAARLLKKLTATSSLHLLVVRRSAEPSDAARWAAWKMTAERVGLPNENVHLLSRLKQNSTPEKSK